MKTVTVICSFLLMVTASAVYGCDESCLKEKAEAANKIQFPGYLSWEYCEDIRMDFITASMTSLDNYKSEHFDTRYKGGMRNIKNYIIQRKAWLEECDQYMQLTKNEPIFDDEKTTKQIFAAMDSITTELDDLLAGVTYSADVGQDSTAVAVERFDKLLKMVDEHKYLMHLKGRYVTR